MSQLSHLLPGRPGTISLGSIGFIPATNPDYTDQYGAKWLRTGVWVPYTSTLYSALSSFSQLTLSKFDVYTNAVPNATRVALIYTGSVFVSVNSAIGVNTSSDGITWSVQAPPTKVPTVVQQRFCYGSGKLIIAAKPPTCSTDNGVTWNTFGLPTTIGACYGFAYGNGVYIVLEYGTGYYYRSTDGINWVVVPANFGSEAYKIVFSGTRFFVFIYGSATIYSSAYGYDAVDWSSSTSTYISYLSSAAISGTNLSCARGDTASTSLRYSTDNGASWNNGTNLPVSKQWLASCGGDGRYIHVSGDTIVYSGSPNTGFSSVASPFSSGPAWETFALVCLNSYFLYSNGGVETKIAYSSTGATWTNWTLTSGQWGKIAYGGGKYLVVNHDGNGQYATATTIGGTWTYRTFPFVGRTISSVEFVNGAFHVLTSNDFLFAKSTDGITWTEVTPRYGLLAVATNGTNFVGVSGNTGYVHVSTDGLSWGDKVLNGDFRCLAYGAGYYVTIAYNSTATARSSDGSSWTSSPTSITSRNWSELAFGNSVFVAIDPGSLQYATSVDGVTWVARTLSQAIHKLEFVNGKFIGGYSSSTEMQISTDGITWTTDMLTSSYNTATAGFAYGGGKYVTISGTNSLVTDFSTNKQLKYGSSDSSSGIYAYARYW